MSLVRWKIFTQRYFDIGSRPSKAEIIEWISDGILYGKVITTAAKTQVFVDENRWISSGSALNAVQNNSNMDLLS